MILRPPSFQTITLGLKSETLTKSFGARLPLWTCDDSIYHVALHLADSIPQSARERILAEREAIMCRQRQKSNIDDMELVNAHYLFSDRLDQYLGNGYGECLLSKLGVAKFVTDALLYYDKKQYELYEFAVMPNHLHMIAGFEVGSEMRKTLSDFKRYTAKGINRLLGRTGPVWARDAYTRIIRDEQELRYQREYVRQNPSRAGLEDWPWVSSGG